MKGIPRVSVLMPVRDAEDTLDACLRSLQRQSLRDWECVLVDDGSSDASLEVARSAQARDPRIRVSAAGRHGIVSALNRGIDLCRGSLVLRMDADDVMHRERVDAQWAALQAEPQLAAVGCHVRLFPRRDLRRGSRAYERWLNRLADPDDVERDAYIECPLAHPTLAVRRDVLQAYRYRDVPWAEDYDLLLRLLADGRRLGVVPRRLLLWRHGAERLSRSDARYALPQFVECKAAFLAEGFLANATSYGLWGYGDTGRSLRRALARHDRHPAHIVELHPGRLGQTIHGAPVVPPNALRELPRRPLLVSVSGEEPRARIRAALATLGFRELRDFVVTA